MKFITIIKPVLAIYLIWCVVSLSFFYLGLMLPGNELTALLLEPVSIAVFIVLASFITMFFMIHVEKHIKEKTSIRLIWLFITFGLFISHYSFVTLTGNKSSLVNSLSTANLLIFACILGNWMTIPVKRPAEIVPLCVIVAFADMFSVFAGPSKHLVENISEYYEGGLQGPPPFVDYLLVKIAFPGVEILMPVFGISDWIIIAFLSAAVCKFNMNDNLIGKGISEIKTSPVFLFFPIAAAGLIVSIVIARVAHIFIPALPVVVIVFLGFMMIKYPEMRKLTKAELVPMLVFSSTMVAFMALI